MKSTSLDKKNIIGIISGVMIIIAPCLKFFKIMYENKEVFDYNLFDFCDRARVVADIWTAIPYAYVLSGVLMLVFCFFKTNLLKIIPLLMLISSIAMTIYAGIYSGKLVMRVFLEDKTKNNMSISQIFKSIGPCSYFIVFGLIIYIIYLICMSVEKSE